MKHFIARPTYPIRVFIFLIFISTVFNANGQVFQNMDFEKPLKENQIQGWSFKNETTQAYIEFG